MNRQTTVILMTYTGAVQREYYANDSFASWQVDTTVTSYSTIVHPRHSCLVGL